MPRLTADQLKAASEGLIARGHIEAAATMLETITTKEPS